MFSTPGPEAELPKYAFEGIAPVVHPTAFIAPTAAIIGDVEVAEGASVWFGATLRGDIDSIVVGRGANVQDGAVVHGWCEIGSGATIAHACVVHTATIGEEALIGNAAVVLDGARIGARALIAAGAVVPPGMEVPDGQLARGVPAAVVGPVPPEGERWVSGNPAIYRELAARYRRGLRSV